MAAIFNLNHPAHVVHWHFIQISVANIVVIVIMLVVFAIALLARFPGHGVGVTADGAQLTADGAGMTGDHAEGGD
jgi:hypothetical protein